MLAAGVYGFNITRPMDVRGLRFVPVHRDYATAKRLSRDQSSYHLTAVLYADQLTSETLFQLEGVLCFIEQLDILITEPIQVANIPEPPTDLFTLEIRTRTRHNGGGPFIAEDAFFEDSRRLFIGLAMGCLNDVEFCRRTKFNSLLFKSVERFRQRQPFLEISYFLLYSGLESYCRAVENDYNTRNSAEPIARVLKSFGFIIWQEKDGELQRSISTYTSLRNALFHNGEMVTRLLINGRSQEIDIVNYLFHITMLVNLTVLKAIGFDDGHINWDSWIDRMPHC